MKVAWLRLYSHTSFIKKLQSESTQLITMIWKASKETHTAMLLTPLFMGFPAGSDGKESACIVGDLGLIPGSGRSPGGGYGNPLQCPWVSLVAQTVKKSWFDPWFGKIPWRRAWQPTPVFLPGEFHGQRSLAGCNPWGHKESAMTEWLSVARHAASSSFLSV